MTALRVFQEPGLDARQHVVVALGLAAVLPAKLHRGQVAGVDDAQPLALVLGEVDRGLTLRDQGGGVFLHDMTAFPTVLLEGDSGLRGRGRRSAWFQTIW